MRFVDDENIPINIFNKTEFVELTAKIERALKILKAQKLNKAFGRALCGELINVFLTINNTRHSSQRIGLTDKYESGFVANELLVVFVPRIGYCRSIGDNQDLRSVNLLTKVIHAQRFAKSLQPTIWL